MTTMTTIQPVKSKTVGINAELHRLLKVLSALDAQQMNELIEPSLWDLVRKNRQRLEIAIGKTLQIPEPGQSELPLAETSREA